MIARIFFFLLGFGLSVIGFTYVIGYLNLLTMGYTFLDYLAFVFRRSECIIAVIGFLLITFSIFKGDNKNDICL